MCCPSQSTRLAHQSLLRIPGNLLGLVQTAQEQLIMKMSLYSAFLLSRETIYSNLGRCLMNKAECPFYNRHVQLLEPTQDTVEGGGLGEIK